METQILWVQAQTLRWVALIFLGIELWIGCAPLTAAWRAAVAALIAMWCVGWGLRIIAEVMRERIATDMAERDVAKEAAAAKETAAAKPPARPAMPRPTAPRAPARA